MAFINKQIYSLPDEFRTDLKLVLDFVERWNKQDAESNVSEAAQRISKVVKECDDEQTKSDLIDNLTHEQEAKLREAHAEQAEGVLDDDMPDNYDHWLVNDVTLEELQNILK